MCRYLNKSDYEWELKHAKTLQGRFDIGQSQETVQLHTMYGGVFCCICNNSKIFLVKC